MMKKIMILLFLSFSFALVLSCFDADVCLAAPKTPKKTIPAKDLQKLADLTGVSTSTLRQYDLDVATALHVYAVAVCAVSDFATVYENSDYGMDFTKFYKRNSITAAVQTLCTDKFNKLNAEFNKTKFEKDKYEGVNKNAAAEAIASKFAVSKSGVLEYGFGSGLPLADIILCAAVSSRTGNSLAVIFEKRKQGTGMELVYASYATLATQQAEITALVNKYNEEIQAAARKGVKAAKVEVTKELKESADKLSGITGVSKDTILEELKKGNSIADIVKAIAITRKLTADLTNILKMKNEIGWIKTNEYYGVTTAVIQGSITAIETDINTKLNPPPPPPAP